MNSHPKVLNYPTHLESDCCGRSDKLLCKASKWHQLWWSLGRAAAAGACDMIAFLMSRGIYSEIGQDRLSNISNIQGLRRLQGLEASVSWPSQVGGHHKLGKTASLGGTDHAEILEGSRVRRSFTFERFESFWSHFDLVDLQHSSTFFNWFKSNESNLSLRRAWPRSVPAAAFVGELTSLRETSPKKSGQMGSLGKKSLAGTGFASFLAIFDNFSHFFTIFHNFSMFWQISQLASKTARFG